MPVVLQNQHLLEMTLQHLRLVRFDPLWMEHNQAEWGLFLICNRLSVTTLEKLTELVHDATRANKPGLVQVICDHERSVAGAWNEGVERASRFHANHLLIMANDVQIRPGCMERLVEFGAARPDIDIWSGAAENNSPPPEGDSEGCDFSCFLFRPETIARFGWFDSNFRPAYFEDNDYCTRVWVGGGQARIVHTARFWHLGSQTIQHDGEMAHHVRYWWNINREYFARKWGSPEVPVSREDALARCFHHPFNEPDKPISWWGGLR